MKWFFRSLILSLCPIQCHQMDHYSHTVPFSPSHAQSTLCKGTPLLHSSPKVASMIHQVFQDPSSGLAKGLSTKEKFKKLI